MVKTCRGEMIDCSSYTEGMNTAAVRVCVLAKTVTDL